MKTAMLFLVLFLAYTVSGQTALTITKAAVRGTPSDKGKIIARLSPSSYGEVVKKSGAWYLVQMEEYVGWLDGNSIEATLSTIDTESIPSSVPMQRLLTVEPIVTRPTTKKADQSHSYIKGPRGGCYYLNSKGNKTYVDRSLCN
jgi:hypothetical protein